MAGTKIKTEAVLEKIANLLYDKGIGSLLTTVAAKNRLGSIYTSIMGIGNDDAGIVKIASKNAHAIPVEVYWQKKGYTCYIYRVATNEFI